MPEQIRTVHKIESVNGMHRDSVNTEERKKRVAAYARVSTDYDEQLTSYEAQVEFYTRYIKGNPDWEFMSVYTDEGISGTDARKREGFNRMIEDALNGKIDLILTKSISRFARNTVDTLTAVRKLKERNVEVYFEKENIRTLDARGEVMITIMSSLAQEESRSISENVTWGKRRSMEEGRFSMAYKYFLGYEKGEDGLPKIIESEAEIVRDIYRRFLDGRTVRSIAEYLTDQNIPTPKGRRVWSAATIMSILQNEKYKGDALLQKTYTADFLTKKVKKNRGEVPQYYIKNSHPAIIDPGTFDLVQKEIERRRPNRRKLYKNSVFSAKIICGECGGFYGRKVWHSNSEKYRKSIWQCNHKYSSKEDVCTTPNLTEAEIQEAFVAAANQLLTQKEQHLRKLGNLLKNLADTSALDKQMEEAKEKHSSLLDKLRSYMAENTQVIQDQEEYNRRFAQMDAECKKAEEETALLQKQILDQLAEKEKTRRSIEALEKCKGTLPSFDESLWNTLVDTVTVFADKHLVFCFRDKTEITVDLPEKTN